MIGRLLCELFGHGCHILPEYERPDAEPHLKCRRCGMTWWRSPESPEGVFMPWRPSGDVQASPPEKPREPDGYIERGQARRLVALVVAVLFFGILAFVLS